MYRDKDKERNWHRIKNKSMWDRWRSEGCCGKCGEPSGKYTLCFKHRVINALSTQRWYAKKKLSRIGETGKHIRLKI